MDNNEAINRIRRLEDALAQVTASLKLVQGIYVRIAATLMRIPGEFVHGDREFVDREAVVDIALKLKNASDMGASRVGAAKKSN